MGASSFNGLLFVRTDAVLATVMQLARLPMHNLKSFALFLSAKHGIIGDRFGDCFGVDCAKKWLHAQYSPDLLLKRRSVLSVR